VVSHTVHVLLARATAPDGDERTREHVASRRALSLVLRGTGDTRPAVTFPDRRASLAHTRGEGVAAAVAADPGGVVAGVGVDIEFDRTPRPETARFFLTPAEQEWLARRPAPAVPRTLLRLWTVKEALFKATPDNDDLSLIDFELADPGAAQGPARRGQHVLGYRTLPVSGGFVSVAVGIRDRRPNMPAVTHESVVDRVSTLLSVPPERLTGDTTLTELVSDSFMLVEVVVDLQEEFGVILTQEDVKTVNTVGDLVTLLRSAGG
jgi:acyl carrier protein